MGSVSKQCFATIVVKHNYSLLRDHLQIIIIVDPDCMFVRPIDIVVEQGAPIAQVPFCAVCASSCTLNSMVGS